MSKASSLRKKQKAPPPPTQRLVVVMALLAFVFFGGTWLLNNGSLTNMKPTNAMKLISPVSGQKIWLKSQESVRFEWSGITREDTFLEVSRDRNFQDLVLEEAAPKSPFLTDKLPGDGDYFYRIVQKSSNLESSHPQPLAFTIVTQNPPQLIYPFSPMSIPEAKPLRFYWQSKHGVSHYRFQIAFDSSFENLFSDLLLDETQTIPQKIPTGHFFWRTRGEDNPAATTLWSEVRVLRSEAVLDTKAQEIIPEKVQRLAATPALTLTAPPPPTTPPLAVKSKNVSPLKSLAIPKVTQTSQKIRLRYRGGNNLRSPASIQKDLLNPPILSWKKSKSATSYEVQVSKKINFTPLEWTKSVSTPEVKWDLAKPGKFFWRVQALDGAGTKSSFSSSNILDLKLPAPKIKKLFSHTVKIKTQEQLSEPSPVPISWANVPAASGYRVLVSENKKFSSNMLDLKVDRNLASLNIHEDGHYFVKVATLDANGEPTSDFSEIATIEYEKKKLIPTPAPSTTPKKIDKKDSLPAPQPKLPPNGVSIVSLNGSQDPISFKWENTDADAFKLEIAVDEDFQQIIHSTVVRESQLVVTKTMPKGKLYWRLRAKKGSIKSDWSPTFSFEFAK